MAGTDLPTKLFWANVQYLCYVTLPVAWLALSLQYTRRDEWLTRRNLALLTEVIIEDDGCGFDPASLPQPFGSAQGKRWGRAGGTLWLAHHARTGRSGGGSLQVRSAPGQGTKVIRFRSGW